MKEYNKTHRWMILPLIFIILFIAADILIIIFLKNTSAYIKFLGIIVPTVLLILDLIYFIVELKRPKISFKSSHDGLYINDDIIRYKDILNLRVSQDILLNIKIIINLKNGTNYKMYHIKNALDVVREIRVKYLKIYR